MTCRSAQAEYYHQQQQMQQRDGFAGALVAQNQAVEQVS